MRPVCTGVCFKCFLALFICIQLVCAAPADSSTSSATSSATSSLSIPPQSSSTHFPSPSITLTSDPTRSRTRGPAGAIDSDDSPRTTRTHAPTVSQTSTHSIIIPPTPRPPQTTWSRSAVYPTHHFPNPANPPPTSNSPRPHRGQSAVAIVFEVLAGAAGLFIVLGLARCFYSYKRTPPRDRISALLDRHRIGREMEEQERDRMERISRALEAYRWRQPPPPYQHAPEYETAMQSPPPDDESIDWGRPSRPPDAQVHVPP